MANTMKAELDMLIKLQEIETEAKSIKSLLDELPRQLEKLDLELQESWRAVEDGQKLLEKLKQEYRAHESDAQMNLSRMEKSKEKLRSVKTNKEYQSSLKEIEDLKTIDSKIEDQMIECLELMDGAEADITQKSERYSDFSTKVNQEKELLKKKSEHGQKKLLQLDTDWEHISKMIDPDLLKKYNSVKKKVGGVALAVIQNAVCQGCNLNIPPQMYNELQRFESLMFCPHCERIIYPLSNKK